MNTTYSKEEKCKNCKYYHQHYVEVDEKLVECYDGHCHYPRLKNRTPNHTCENFKRKDDKEYYIELLCKTLKGQLQQAINFLCDNEFSKYCNTEDSIKTLILKFIDCEQEIEDIGKAKEQ